MFTNRTALIHNLAEIISGTVTVPELLRLTPLTVCRFIVQADIQTFFLFLVRDPETDDPVN